MSIKAAETLSGHRFIKSNRTKLAASFSAGTTTALLTLRPQNPKMSVTVSLYCPVDMVLYTDHGQLHTTHGDLKVELFCEAVPQTAEVRLTSKSKANTKR